MQRVKRLKGSSIRTINYTHESNMRFRNYFDLRDIYVFRKARDKSIHN